MGHSLAVPLVHHVVKKFRFKCLGSHTPGSSPPGDDPNYWRRQGSAKGGTSVHVYLLCRGDDQQRQCLTAASWLLARLNRRRPVLSVLFAGVVAVYRYNISQSCTSYSVRLPVCSHEGLVNFLPNQHWSHLCSSSSGVLSII
jgi:hypothetical protein